MSSLNQRLGFLRLSISARASAAETWRICDKRPEKNLQTSDTCAWFLQYHNKRMFGTLQIKYSVRVLFSRMRKFNGDTGAAHSIQ
jgi:hypothetical protein